MIQFVVAGLALLCIAVHGVPTSRVKNFANVECGKVLIKRESKIIGGSDTFQGEFPWLASIKSEDGDHFCGGFVVSERFVVSVGHCFLETIFNPLHRPNVKVVLGAKDLKTSDSHSLEYSVEEIKIHPNFTFVGYVNDIALIRLNQSITWSPFIQPICLPNENFHNELSRRGISEKSLTVAGWGLTSEGQSYENWKNERVLKKTEMPLWDNQLCENAYLKNGVNFRIQQSHMCAGVTSGERDTCQGDSGSPICLLDEAEKQWIALGIVSTGKGCARGLPGIYTKSSNLLDRRNCKYDVIPMNCELNKCKYKLYNHLYEFCKCI